MSTKPQEQTIAQYLARENQWKKQKALLQQNYEFLQQELKQYRQREANSKKLNESIMITYQQNQNIREEHISREIRLINEKHQEELARVRDAGYRQCKALEDSLADYKARYEQLLIENDRKGVDFQRRILEVKKKYEADLKKERQELQAEYESKLELMTQKMKQAESMAEIYQQFVQKRRETNGEEDSYLKMGGMGTQMRRSESSKENLRAVGPMRESLGHENVYRQSRKERIRDIQENNIKDLRRLSASRQSVKHLTAKIQRAVIQLKGSTNQKLHQKISQKLSKRMY